MRRFLKFKEPILVIAFGLMARTTGLHILETAAMSFFVFAGASQFAALKLLSEDTTHLHIILATFFLNLRHLLMSASLAFKWKNKAGGIIHSPGFLCPP